jgi:hypothetical protein
MNDDVWFTPDEWEEMVRDACEGSYRLTFEHNLFPEDMMLVKIGKITIPVDMIAGWEDRVDNKSDSPEARILTIFPTAAPETFDNYFRLRVNKADVEQFESDWRNAKLELMHIPYALRD